MPRLTLTLALVLLQLVVWAVPARKGTLRQVSKADGAPLVVTLVGDEYAHWWEDDEGNMYSVDSAGCATLLPSASVAALTAQGTARRAAREAVRQQRRVRAAQRAQYVGTQRGLVILVNFLNKAMSSATASDDFDRMFNAEGYAENNHIGCVADYFRDQSYGLFDIAFDIVGPVAVSQNYSYYGANDIYGEDIHPCELVTEACILVNDEVNFADYDWDGDGEVEQVFIIYAGYGENGGGGADTIWPHEWDLYSGGWYGDGNGAITLDGVRINTYAMTCELTGNRGTTLAGMGVACHEFSHCLGFPDFYDTSYSGGWGMQEWDLLDGGAYNGPTYNGEVPAGYTAYERWMVGWLDPTPLTAGMTVSALPPLGETPEAYVLYNDGDANEYYLLENRQSDRWFQYLYSYTAPSGLLITHVDYDQRAWEDNNPNSLADHQRMTIFQANNQKGTFNGSYYNITAEQYQGHVYPYNANDSLTALSTPAATLYNANADGTLFMNKGIYDIVRNGDGTLAFACYGASSGGDDDEPAPDEGEVIFYESFDACSGTGGNDGLWSGNIAHGAFLPDNDGWECVAANGANQCARFGTTEKAGYVVSPSFTLTGDATISFKIGVWDAAADDETVDLYVAGKFYYLNYICKGAWTEVSIPITYYGSVNLKFSPNNRFFLDEVKVVARSTNGIDAVPAAAAAQERIYNLAGQYVGTSLAALPPGVYVVNKKKIVRQ